MIKNIKKTDTCVSKLVDLKLKADKLPDLSPVEKTKFDQMLAINQLYYSSKLEGSNLTKIGLDKAIHGANI